ncbi:bifunctional phosphoribosylaminoimidazolecarboxamide formyltransferase/IMP cyclohydrolase [Bacteroidota bacterium]
MVKYAVISVSDKKNILPFARGILRFNYKIIATGNTATLLNKNNIDCINVQNYTNFPEIFSGRVKTLHPKIFGGILQRPDIKGDIAEATKNNINPIEIICVNLYPFSQVVKRDDVSHEVKIENIDIGGPSLIRAAAKNYKFVSVLTNSNQYEEFLTELESGEISIQTKQRLAYEAFAHTSNYDTKIADYFENEFNQSKSFFRVNEPLYKELRYGENPHQKGFLFGNFNEYFDVLHGKELSYNNIMDLSAGYELVNEFEPVSCAIIKHSNPCGAAYADNVFNAYKRALAGDPVSAFGGIVVFNDKVDAKTATLMDEIFLEIICAHEFDTDALQILKKKKNRRLIKSFPGKLSNRYLFKNLYGGIVMQEFDNSKIDDGNLRLVSARKISQSEKEDLIFAWKVCKHTKSNSIVYVKNNTCIGVGAGQMSRVDSVKIGANKAKEFGHELNGAVVASDAFFPFADNIHELAKNGVTAVIQPGGSVRDEEVIRAVDNNNISMIFTGIRNFKH